VFRIGAALFAFLCVSPAGAAETIRLSLPVNCELGVICFIQQYVDPQVGTGAGDYKCNNMSYHGHKGTDFRVRDYVDMQRGVAVIAAAPGVVSATRDGMPDISMREVGVAALLGNLAGNGVVIDHGDGWQTQYNHLQSGSIEIKPGDKIARGQRLALIGLSGKTEFPHLDLTVRRNGKVIDPFTGLAAPGGCDGKKSPLWHDDALAATRYCQVRS
jgi:murein DD-endopeptidase MepM/ murein hydrolase activator NlpD